MATLRTLTVLTTAAGQQAASAPTHFVRQQEFSGTLAGKANLQHRHDAADIDNLIPLLMTLAEQTREDTDTVFWTPSGTGANVRLQPNGGLLAAVDGLFIDSGTVSLPGHHHVAADIDDFATALFQNLEILYRNSSTIDWSFAGDEVSGTVRLAPAGGLLDTPDGVALDFGSGTNQAARGDHTHAQLHAPVTLGASQSLGLELAGQQLSGEVVLAALSGLKISADGLAADFGSGTNQVARGTHSHALLHNPVTVQGDAALVLAISAEQELSGTVRIDPAPPGGFGKLDVGAGGLMVELGTDSDQAAAGDHGHSLATESESGFMSASDKQHIDVLWQEVSGTETLPPSGTMDSLQVRVLYLVNVNTGQRRAIYLDDAGNVAVISGSGSMVATNVLMQTTNPDTGGLVASPGLLVFNTANDSFWIKKSGNDGNGWKEISGP